MSSPAPVTADVGVVLVSHDGARWLPAVLEGLAEQGIAAGHAVAVDTASKDQSAELGEAAGLHVARLPGSTGYPAAVREGLRLLPERCSWVWLLHDDSRPAPGALAALLGAAAEHPEADVLGPKLREWPSLRRLLELGVTISGTGRRETGLERGEYDQGQHDEVRQVLAVNTAGMLVRRSVLEELGGFDDQLPVFGNDLDFGWRAAAAGHTTLVVPQAVVFHAEAAHRGLRRTPLTGRHTHYQERRAALYTLLANSRARALPWQVLRLTLGTLLRVVGFLLVRSVGQALDELAAMVSLWSRPRQVLAARRQRQARAAAEPADVRALLPPPWLPYRHGLDFVGDLVSAATDQAADVAERRRAAAAERDPSSFAARRVARDEDEDGPDADSGWVARLLTNPVALALALVVVAAVVGAREALGTVVGGGLAPAPEATGDWWRLHLESWHALGQGTPVPAPAYLLPLALLATLVGGPAPAVTVVLVLAVPLGLWGAWRFLRLAGRLVSPSGAPRWLLLWGATTYSLVPVVSGAWGDGRLGPVVVSALLPWTAHAAVGFADPEADRRWRAAWRVGLLLTMVTAFGPVSWLLALLIGLVVWGTAYAVLRAAALERSVWAPPLVSLGTVPLVLAPWWLPLLVHGAGAGLLLDPGRLPAPGVDGADLLLGRVGDLGAPAWLGLVPLVLAAAALVPRATRIPVLLCWIVVTAAGLLAAALSVVELDLRAVSVEPGLAPLVVVVQGALVVAAAIGLQGFVRDGRARQVAVAVAALVAVAPVAGLGWFLLDGEDRLSDSADTGIPAYMVQSSEQGPEHGILVVRGSTAAGMTYLVRRDDGITLGEDEVVALSGEDEQLTSTVRELVARPTPGVVDRLAAAGIEHVVLPSPADGQVAAALDATGGLVQASAEDRSTRAWRVDRPLDPDAVDGPASWWRALLLIVQGIAVLVVLVLAAPTSSRRQR